MNIELRDYFAAKAMAAYFTDASVAFDTNTIERGSKVAYALADAMLAAREAGKSEKKADDGWIEWSGGECPVDPCAIVEIRMLSSETEVQHAHQYRWDHKGYGGDIIAYRVVRP